ncbi:MAG: acetylornithine/succinylornithine family transaminase [bacterium]|nr:acetylornithine/succinylornithine family transaminase [bacterium]
MRDLKQLEETYGCEIYPRRDIQLVSGKNAYVWDSDGKKYIDCVTGHGVASIGHCNDDVVEAVTHQVRKLITCSGVFFNDARAVLSEKLVENAPASLKQVFLCNSGAEAMEAAIKFARFSTGKTDFVSALKGFHGRTIGALTATFTPKYRKPFEPLVPGFSYAAYNKFDKLVEKVTDKTAGIILEIVQGEGGVYVGDAEYFKQVEQLCKDKGIMLIIDEVQTGFCRTGKMFACEHFGVEPDILTMAKAIAGGVPMGGVLISERITPPKGNHGSTFGGNPLACAAANAAIDFMLKNDLPKMAVEKSAYLKENLLKRNLKGVKEIRGLGLMMGLDLEQKVKDVILTLMDDGLLTLPAGKNVLRLLPPITIEYKDLDIVVDKIANCLGTN